jgi:hypothetical protein
VNHHSLNPSIARAGLSLKWFGDGHYSFFVLVLWFGFVFLVHRFPDAEKGVVLVEPADIVFGGKKVFPESG